MNKKLLASMGLMWISGLCAGTIVGMNINEKLNQKYVVPNIDRYRDLAELFKDELYKSDKKIEELEKKLNKEEA